MSTTFDQDTTTQEVIAGVDLSGKTVVITGGSAGLGVETGRVMAAAGAKVVMVARDMSKLEAAIATIRQHNPAADLETQQMDLADLSTVRAAGQSLLARFPQIDILINNAGVMACPQDVTADGFELQFGTNHLGHFLFTCLLVPSLLAAAPARVICLSSAGHKMGEVTLGDVNYERREYDKWEAYGQSKTANAQFAAALNARLADRGVTACAVHPGMIVTELGRHLSPEDIAALMARGGSASPHFKSVEAGAATSVWAATSPELEGRGGLYLEDCHVGEVAGDDMGNGYLPYALDLQKADALWQLSEEMVGEHFALTS